MLILYDYDKESGILLYINSGDNKNIIHALNVKTKKNVTLADKWYTDMVVISENKYLGLVYYNDDQLKIEFIQDNKVIGDESHYYIQGFSLYNSAKNILVALVGNDNKVHDLKYGLFTVKWE